MPQFVEASTGATEPEKYTVTVLRGEPAYVGGVLRTPYHIESDILALSGVSIFSKTLSDALGFIEDTLLAVGLCRHEVDICHDDIEEVQVTLPYIKNSIIVSDLIKWSRDGADRLGLVLTTRESC